MSLDPSSGTRQNHHPVSGGSRGGGGPGGPDPPLLGHDVGFLTLGPKLDPPPPFVNVQEWGCFSNFLRSDDVTRTMSKGGGVLVKNLVSVPGPPPPFKNPGSAPARIQICSFQINMILNVLRKIFWYMC